jgi:hypothetical protein
MTVGSSPFFGKTAPGLRQNHDAILGISNHDLGYFAERSNLNRAMIYPRSLCESA